MTTQGVFRRKAHRPDRRGLRRRLTRTLGPWQLTAIGIGGITTVLFAFLLGAARVGHSTSRDGLLPPWFAKTPCGAGQRRGFAAKAKPRALTP
jgi:hypothetical protein